MYIHKKFKKQYWNELSLWIVSIINFLITKSQNTKKIYRNICHIYGSLGYVQFVCLRKMEIMLKKKRKKMKEFFKMWITLKISDQGYFYVNFFKKLIKGKWDYRAIRSILFKTLMFIYASFFNSIQFNHSHNVKLLEYLSIE